MIYDNSIDHLILNNINDNFLLICDIIQYYY